MISTKNGFTMIEILVVIAILGVLASITTINIRINLLKSRDAVRKSDLNSIQKALEMYVNDNGFYPTGLNGFVSINGLPIEWGNSFNSGTTIYMNKLPKDPLANPDYCYQNSGSTTNYQIYARLENSKDSLCLTEGCAGSRTCNNDDSYNYGVSSSNISP